MTTPNAAALKISEATLRYGETIAFENVSLELSPGEFHVLLGPSGSGKTSLLRAVAGFECLEEGSILLEDRVVDGPSNKARVSVPPERRGIGFVFQDYALFPHLSVAGNVSFSRKMADPEIVSQLKDVGLEEYAERFPNELSGGQQQRVALARALASQPRLMCLDEPLSNIDRGLRRSLRSRMLKLLRERGTASLFVTHDVEEGFAMADRASVLANGRLLQTGEPRELYQEPATLDVAETVGDAEVLPATRGTDEGFVETAIGKVGVRGGSGELLMLRPEQLHVLPPASKGSTMSEAAVTIRSVRHLGPFDVLEIVAGDNLVLHARSVEVGKHRPGPARLLVLGGGWLLKRS